MFCRISINRHLRLLAIVGIGYWCLQENVIYQATAKVGDEPDIIYLGATECPWKDRFYSHKTAFNNSMKTSNYVWEQNDKLDKGHTLLTQKNNYNFGSPKVFLERCLFLFLLNSNSSFQFLSFSVQIARCIS